MRGRGEAVARELWHYRPGRAGKVPDSPGTNSTRTGWRPVFPPGGGRTQAHAGRVGTRFATRAMKPLEAPTPPVPLVSIGIPTCNRAAGLQVAVRSAQAQSYPRLEILITDNASDDSTPEVGAALAKADPRVRYVRHPHNLGPTANFEAARRLASGPYFLWLADDDWLGPDYVRRCVEVLETEPDHALVAGRTRYYQTGKFSFDARPVNALARKGSQRVLQYYRQVGDNGTFYGVMRLALANRIPLANVMGGDWLFVAALAFLGRVRTLPDVTIHREFTWDDTSHERIVRSLGLPAFQAREPRLTTAVAAYRDIRARNPVFQALGPATRWWLACRAGRILCRRHGVRLPKLLRLYFGEKDALREALT
jgi:glycosyltransferase involved in cell wall biosynthesis